MACGEQLVAMIASSDLVARLRELARAIRASDADLKAYRDILALQQRLVNAAAKGETARVADLRRTYDAALAALVSTPVVATYLDLLAELNDVAQETAAILKTGMETE